MIDPDDFERAVASLVDEGALSPMQADAVRERVVGAGSGWVASSARPAGDGRAGAGSDAADPAGLAGRASGPGDGDGASGADASDTDADDEAGAADGDGSSRAAADDTDAAADTAAVDAADRADTAAAVGDSERPPTSEPRDQRDGIDELSTSALLVRVSGLLLVALATANFVDLYLVHDATDLTSSFLNERWQAAPRRFGDWSFLVLGVLHGCIGARWAIRRVVGGPGAQLALEGALYGVIGSLLAYASWVVLRPVGT